MGILDTPDWIKQYVDKWVARLHLTQWRVRVVMALAPGNSVYTAATCSQVQNIAEATLTFRADAEDTQDWRETILHEVLHIAHGHVDQVIYNVLLDGMAQSEKDKSYQAYCDAMEKFVDGMSKIFYQLEQEAARSSQETNQNEVKTERRPLGFVPSQPVGTGSEPGSG
jgi:hypothetical protein